MAQLAVEMDVRSPAPDVQVWDIRGEVTAAAEDALLALQSAAVPPVKTVILNMDQVPAVDSRGAGLLISLAAHLRRRGQRVLAYGLNEPCRRAFELTHLDERIGLYATESEALGKQPESGPPPLSPINGWQRWAEPADRFHIAYAPPEAITVNVHGRRFTGPVKGFGALWRRTYAVRLVSADVTPITVANVWKERFASFWPPSGRFYGPDKPIEVGDKAVLNLLGPAGLIIATGIRVIYADEKSFCFMSAEGHMIGGMITFSAYTDQGTTVAQVQALLRASDPLFEVAFRLGIATKPEDQFWQGTLQNLAAHFGVEGQAVDQQVILLDPGLQWSQAKNIWYNGAIRSMLYTPVRWIRREGTP